MNLCKRKLTDRSISLNHLELIKHVFAPLLNFANEPTYRPRAQWHKKDRPNACLRLELIILRYVMLLCFSAYVLSIAYNALSIVVVAIRAYSMWKFWLMTLRTNRKPGCRHLHIG